MNKVLPLFLFLFLITSCSLDQKSGIWTKVDKIENDKDFVIVELFKDERQPALVLAIFDTDPFYDYKIYIESTQKIKKVREHQLFPEPAPTY